MEERNRKKSTSSARLKEIIGVLGRNELAKGLSPVKLRRILEDLGPTFVKFGQMMSMRPDMIPIEYCEELKRLRTDVKPLPYNELLDVLKGEFGEQWNDIFVSIDRTPIGSASIAQVHKAVLNDGRNMAVKVQRPGIYETMAQDVRLLHKASRMFRVIGRTGKVIDLNGVIDEMWEAARQELDFIKEAEHIKEFTEANTDVDYIAFPKVDWTLTTSKVLVMEYVEGIPINDSETLIRQGYDLKEIGSKLAINFAKQILDDGFFHADPHPGNIHIRAGKIVWIDLGMTGRIMERDRQLLTSAVSAVAEGDIDTLTDTIMRIGIHKRSVDYHRLYSDIEGMVSKYGSLELKNIDLGEAIRDFINLAEKNGISMPPGISMLGRGLMTIEGVLSIIDPEISFLQVVAEYMGQSIWADFDLSREIKKGGKQLYRFGKNMINLPAYLLNVLKMTAKGQTRLNVEYTVSEPTHLRFRRLINRLILSLLCMALIIGSSLLCMSGLEVCFAGMPLVSLIGYVLALILGIVVIGGMAKDARRSGD